MMRRGVRSATPTTVAPTKLSRNSSRATAVRSRGYRLGGDGPVCIAALATVDLLSRRRDDPPRSAGLVQTLARRLAGLVVTDEVVERATAVGNFELSVRALRRPEQRSAHARTGNRLRLGQQRRPDRSAGAVAGALP